MWMELDWRCRGLGCRKYRWQGRKKKTGSGKVGGGGGGDRGLTSKARATW